MNNKERYINTLLGLERQGMNGLVKELEEGGFFKAPCSTQYHLAKDGGLLKHSLNVAEVAEKMYQALVADNPLIKDYIPIKSVILCALLHDIGKMNDYEVNILKSGKQSDSKPYITSKNPYPEAHEDESVRIASKHIELTDNERYAIQMHNGMYGEHRYTWQGHETPLALLIHNADMWCSRVTEVLK